MKQQPTQGPPISAPGQEIVLDIDSLAFGGQGIGRLDGFVVFVDDALPGQRVRARVTMPHKRHAQAQALEILTASPDQVEPLCLHADVCGGCAWQKLSYPAQLYWKRQLVKNTLQHLAGMPEIEVPEVIASPRVTLFRNKMEFTFSDGAGPDLDLGLYRHGSHLIAPIRQCLLQPGPVAELLKQVRDFCRQSGLAGYDPATGRGFWRVMIVRTTQSGQMLINLITCPLLDGHDSVKNLAAGLMETFPEVIGLVHSTRRSRDRLSLAEKTVQVFGQDFLEETLADLTIHLSAGSFFQTNTEGAGLLYQTIEQMAEIKADEQVLDMYCGSGALGLWLAKRTGARVTGVDINREAIADARTNALLNGLTNCRFQAIDAGKFVQTRNRAPDVLIADPPRAGLSAQALQGINDLGPQKIIYVSCNPATQARDIVLFSHSYKLDRIQPVDLFPHNPHVENIALLRKRTA